MHERSWLQRMRDTWFCAQYPRRLEARRHDGTYLHSAAWRGDRAGALEFLLHLGDQREGAIVTVEFTYYRWDADDRRVTCQGSADFSAALVELLEEQRDRDALTASRHAKRINWRAPPASW